MDIRKKILIAAPVALLLLAAASAAALTLRAGDLIISAEGGFAPKALPRHENAPITLHGGGKIATASGALPPILQTLDIEFDRHGSVVTTGLPICTKAKLVATTTAVARRKCAGSIVGEGHGSAIVKFPEQAPIPASSPITLFNGPPEHGDPTVLAHAYLSVPAPTAYIVPVVIETIHHGLYGYRTKATIPKIAGGAGIPISGSLKIGKKWSYKGKKLSYINARCETGRLQAKADFTFDDGTFLTGTFLRPCTVRG
ncbi:MAG TPA: hypothetical protein VHU86_00130 [Solirubrobacterales bacterium]|jgi:hypothetical protein|nr:hypothetical protein [Solirubrobacterales bacterium]